MVDRRAKKLIAPKLAEFREQLMEDRENGATNVELVVDIERAIIRASKLIAQDPELVAWLTEEFLKVGEEVAAMPAGERDRSKFH
jgi:hypothetical protein